MIGAVQTEKREEKSLFQFSIMCGSREVLQFFPAAEQLFTYRSCSSRHL